LIISQANSLRNRNVIRQTWSKQLSSNTRFVFVVGNPAFNSSSQLDRQIQTRLKEESQKFNDIIQINMSDDESYLPTKTLIAIRWSLTYCAIASHLFILSDSAVLNVNLFHKKINLKDLENHTLVGACNYTDAKFASGLKLFFDGIPKKINKRESKDSKRPMNVSSSRSDRAASYYKGEYCSNLGWLISMQGAKQLWLAALRSTYIMKISPAFLNGYLAFKANLKHSDQFVYQDMVPMNTNCLRVLEENRMSMMACAENFTISNRYNSFISTWNSAPVFGLSKLWKLYMLIDSILFLIIIFIIYCYIICIFYFSFIYILLNNTFI